MWTCKSERQEKFHLETPDLYPAWFTQYEVGHPEVTQRLDIDFKDPKEALASILKYFVADLLGESLISDEDFKTKLLKLNLCDICMLDDFVNLYIGYIFSLKTLDRKMFWIKGFFFQNILSMEWSNTKEIRSFTTKGL